jgi:AAA+ superfamily predicted ATPase
VVDQALSSIAGLETLKQKMRELADADEKNVKLHMLHVVLKGNTGVGKTTVAQAIADVYFRLGLVKKRGVVEVNREHLVGKALGETEERTEAQIKEALGGVMFVDEAYALNGDLYGRQYVMPSPHSLLLFCLLTVSFLWDRAITLLMNHLNRDQVVFIFAGYEGDMNEFLKVNPGFRQRIAFEFILPDYTPLQLAEILKVKIEHEELKLPEDVLGKGLVEMISRNFPDYIIRGANGTSQYCLRLQLHQHGWALSDAHHYHSSLSAQARLPESFLKA